MIEISLMVNFAEKRAPQQTKEQSIRYFYCSRSYRKSKNDIEEDKSDPPLMKKRKTEKMASYCTSTMTVIQSTVSDEVQVEICLTHYGHELDRNHLASLRVPILERNKLAG